jgi:uncharacterized phosphosugar-binding protein
MITIQIQIEDLTRDGGIGIHTKVVKKHPVYVSEVVNSYVLLDAVHDLVEMFAKKNAMPNHAVISIKSESGKEIKAAKAVARAKRKL